MEIRLTKGSNRNTQAHVVRIGNHEFYFSYQTCIAYRGPLGSARIANHWGPTTGRHFREMGISDLPVLGDTEFDARVNSAVTA